MHSNEEKNTFEMKDSVEIWVSKHWLGLFGLVVTFFGVIIACIVALYNIQLGICHERLEICKERMGEIRTLKNKDFNQFVLIIRGSDREREFIKGYSEFLKKQLRSAK